MFTFLSHIRGYLEKDFEFCGDRGCGIKLNVEGSGHFDGLYELEQGYHNNRKRVINVISIGHFRSLPVKN